jgi:hypothetical protein
MSSIKKLFSDSIQSIKYGFKDLCGGMEKRLKKPTCLETVKGDNHLILLGKETAIFSLSAGRFLVDTVKLPGTMLAKGVMKLCGYTPTTAGILFNISQAHPLRLIGKFLGDIGAVSRDGLLFLGSTAVSACKLVGYVGKGVGYVGKGAGNAIELCEKGLHYVSDKKEQVSKVLCEKDLHYGSDKKEQVSKDCDSGYTMENINTALAEQFNKQDKDIKRNKDKQANNEIVHDPKELNTAPLSRVNPAAVTEKMVSMDPVMASMDPVKNGSLVFSNSRMFWGVQVLPMAAPRAAPRAAQVA